MQNGESIFQAARRISSNFLNYLTMDSTANGENDGISFKAQGVDIRFPFEPYGVQKAIMGKLTKTLTNSENCLIESPTGTGKTLVLLTCALAWQHKSKSIGQPFISQKLRLEKAERKRQNLLSRPCTCGRRPGTTELDELKAQKDKSKNIDGKTICIDDNAVDDIDDFKNFKKAKMDLEVSPYFKQANNEASKPEPDLITIDDDDIVHEEKQQTETTKAKSIQTKTEDEFQASIPKDLDSNKPMCKSCLALQNDSAIHELMSEESADSDMFLPSKFRKKIPKIYYGTRTHKQITQVIRELNKTPYRKDLKMCILSARERVCVNDDVKDLSTRNDKCLELVRNRQGNSGSKNKATGDTCPYYSDSNSIAQMYSLIDGEFSDRAWDIEDAAKFGRDNKSCPYYGLRSLQEQADITFSPYNYILDPIIRKNMNININNAIVILDEAHNIEDTCRDSASFNIDSEQIDELIDTINITSSHYMQDSNIHNAYRYFRDLFATMKICLKNSELNPNSGDRDIIAKKVAHRREMLEILIPMQLGPENLVAIRDQLKALRGDDAGEDGESKSSKSDSSQQALSSIHLQLISNLTMVMDFMYSNKQKYLNDYKLVIKKSLKRDFNKSNKARYSKANRDDPSGESATYVWQFSLLCMNSSVSFDKIHGLAWSVIVASGTLSPIESLRSELGCTFENVFEGSHVIPADRIFATILSSGPNRIDLNCAFTNSLKLDFQDEVGYVIRDVCQTVPNGVLCFFPSYDRMDNFYTRWMSKGIMGDIQRQKKVFRERKNLTSTEFELELENYNRFANKKGAVLFAVFRGKVSEGIDFADNTARAVITIGIPYPNVKDVVVGLKREYNDESRKERPNLMPGGDWYAAQAFRALNQALGRCIRHREDWGAIIMIDSRLYGGTQNISKWLRSVMYRPNNYSDVKRQLEYFVSALQTPG